MSSVLCRASRIQQTLAYDETPSEDGMHDVSPPKKRQKKSLINPDKRSSRPLKKQGFLAKLVQMPIDILFEIFGHLQPLDVLRLSRTSKALRNLLMHRTSTCVWKSARRNLPHADLYLEPPKDMSEPAYAHLLFDTRCNFCHTVRVKHPFWAWRVRCCKNCLLEYFDDVTGIFKRSPGIIEGEFCYCQPTEDHPIKRHGRIYLKTALTQFRKRAKEAKAKGEEAALLKERHLTVAYINKRAADERKYSGFREDVHDRDLQESRQKRQEAIKRELCALGWEEEFNLMSEYDHSFKRHSLVSQLRPLTNRIWSNIQAPMINFMEEVRAKRMERERIDCIIQRQDILVPLLETYRRSRFPGEFVPQNGDIICMAPFAAVLESDRGIEVTTDSFTDSVAQLPELCVKWRQEKDNFLSSLLVTPEAGGFEKTKPHKTALELATTLFNCKSCMKHISYPRILSHECMTDERLARIEAIFMGVESMRRFTSLSSVPWNYRGDSVVYHKKAAIIAAGILKASGMDPDVTTAQQMDLRQLRFVCRCKHMYSPPLSQHNCYFMNWRSAIEHALQNHSENTSPWIVFDGDVRPGDEFILRKIRPAEKKGTLEDMKRHLRDSHNLTLDEVTDHYYMHPDTALGARVSYIFTEILLDLRDRLNLDMGAMVTLDELVKMAEDSELF